ncbi:hypothetical protein, partial [uncultured Planktosalinus sp.]|uniref:hypothetical protein n=1 Tax=uncultured Planktosalinus sp. TaxID=1810935 RepID=UPI0030DD6D4D
MSVSAISQEDKAEITDTIAHIQNLQQTAYESILIQELDNVVPKLLEAKDLANKINDSNHKALVSTTLAYFYYSIYSYNLASTECAKAISYVKDDENSKTLAIAYSLYGLISLKTNNKENAERYLDRADRIFQTLNEDVELAKVKYKKGLFALENENIQVALNYFTAALQVFENSNIPYYEAIANQHIAMSLI